VDKKRAVMCFSAKMMVIIRKVSQLNAALQNNMNAGAGHCGREACHCVCQYQAPVRQCVCQTGVCWLQVIRREMMCLFAERYATGN